MKTKEEMIDLIKDWEYNAGESFTDYFMHDNVVWANWLFWLLGKGGHDEFAVKALEKLSSGEDYLDQEELFDMHNTVENWNDENYDKNVELWAEFLTATPTYQKRLEEFLKD